MQSLHRVFHHSSILSDVPITLQQHQTISAPFNRLDIIRKALLMRRSEVADEEAVRVLPAQRENSTVAVGHSSVPGDTPLISAIIQGNAARVDDLITAGASITSQNEDGLNSLHEAVLHHADTPILDILLSAGVDPDARDIYGATPLLMAARENDVRSVDFLITYGADINAQDAEGWTSVLVAVANKSPELLRLLLVRGADCSLYGREGAIWDVATECGDLTMISILRDAI